MKKQQDNFNEMLAILSDGEYHDGNQLGETLNITRSAVWKNIKKLENYHIPIKRIKGKGYALAEPLIPLNTTKIQTASQQTDLDLTIFETIDSTNRYLREFKHLKTPKFCLAEQQTAGKGRFNREWYSPFGKNIYLSCLYPFQKDLSALAGLSLMTSLAVLKALNHFHKDSLLAVKWPNDIVYGKQKISGNLIEVQAESHSNCQAIIGIGINVNMLDDENHITQEWTSLQKITTHYVDRNPVCGQIIYYLMQYLTQFNETGFAPFIDEWNRFDCLTQKTIHLKNVNDIITGKVLGVNEQGYLSVQLDTNEIVICSSGETTILK